jgi:hypothetical protein
MRRCLRDFYAVGNLVDEPWPWIGMVALDLSHRHAAGNAFTCARHRRRAHPPDFSAPIAEACVPQRLDEASTAAVWQGPNAIEPWAAVR